jgi:DNA polymerase-3 subunit delta
MPPTTVLVLIDGGVKDNPLLKELRPLASVKEFPMLRGTALTGWIQRRVTANGGSISARAAKMLAELAGDDLWVLSGEVEKLVLYALGRRIEEEDVRKVASAAREFNVFAMVDALVEGRAVVATRALHQLLEEGMTAPHILSMITRQLRIMLQGKELSLSRIPAPEIKKRLSMASPYAVTKALEQSRRYSLERLEQVYRKLLDTDLAIKRGVWKGELALDLLVVELCA